jgi:antitoxin (DNA-binding transcriptional repressor) of toxin-antitoxin stability system
MGFPGRLRRRCFLVSGFEFEVSNATPVRQPEPGDVKEIGGLAYHVGVNKSLGNPVDSFGTPLYTSLMKLSISEARKRLPELVRQVRKDAGAKVEIMVRDEVVAELRAALPEPEPGAAAKKLVELMRRLPKHRGRKTDVSRHVNEHLYGSGAKSR